MSHHLGFLGDLLDQLFGGGIQHADVLPLDIGTDLTMPDTTACWEPGDVFGGHIRSHALDCGPGAIHFGCGAPEHWEGMHGRIDRSYDGHTWETCS